MAINGIKTRKPSFNTFSGTWMKAPEWDDRYV